RSMLQGHLIAAGFEAEFAKNLSFLVVPVIEVILFWPVLRHNKHALLKLFRPASLNPHILLAAFCIGLATRITYWGALIATAAFDWLGYAEPGTNAGPLFWFACPPPAALILSLLVLAVLTPISEEIINRGLILGALSRRKPIVAVVVSALLFAILHDPQGIPAAFVIGMLLALQTLNSRSLLPSMVTHASYNSLRILDWDCFHGIWNPEFVTAGSRLVGTAAIVVGSASLAVAFWLALRIKGQGKLAAPAH
ncbi:MAG: membrane protease YdiL (CAAX protease family), partial [Woeseiaceae bacterium]